MIRHFFSRLLLSIDRRQSADEMMDTVSLAEKYRMLLESADSRVRVVGVDLSGDPSVCNYDTSVISTDARDKHSCHL